MSAMASQIRRLDCLLNCLFRRRSKKTSKLRITGLCEGSPPMTDGCPPQRASNAENVSIWWGHHEYPHHSYAAFTHGNAFNFPGQLYVLFNQGLFWGCAQPMGDDVSHWLGAYTKWSLLFRLLIVVSDNEGISKLHLHTSSAQNATLS